MYAVVGRWTADRSRADQQRVGLRGFIIPGVTRNPGFVHGYWAEEPGTDLEVTFIVFDSEENARSFAASVEANRDNQARSGIDLHDLVIVDIHDEAPSH